MSTEEHETESPWNGVEPLLRLFHALVQNDILPDYLEQQQSLPEEDSFEHQLDIWSRITDLFNDPTFLPKSYFLPSLHRDFTGEKELPPLEEKQSITDLFSRFTICKKQMISLRNYIFDDTQYQFSKIKPTILSLLRQSSQQEKLSVLYTFPSTLLYLWHLDDAFQWLTPLEMNQDGTGGLLPFDKRRRAHPGLLETQMINIQDPWGKLQSAEKHHSEMAKTYADMVSKMSTIGGHGNRQNLMLNIVDNIKARVDASYDRCIGIETNIISQQRDFE